MENSGQLEAIFDAISKYLKQKVEEQHLRSKVGSNETLLHSQRSAAQGLSSAQGRHKKSADPSGE
jgi:hypothetical protein